MIRSARSRRTQLITLLSHIFPLDAVTESNSPLLFSILSIPLPNSSYLPSVSDDELSSALGYAAQVVSTLAGYLGVPLHYPIQVMGSRSAVLDLISVMRGPRAFPLYGRGVERYRFDYGVFLLNKNIEQVRLQCHPPSLLCFLLTSLFLAAYVLPGADSSRSAEYPTKFEGSNPEPILRSLSLVSPSPLGVRAFS